MGRILCATRGGEQSYRTQDAAIALAKERGDTLLFLYVVDLRFLDTVAGAGVVDTEQEMTRMGEFLVLMAKERAAEQGVAAETMVREGDVEEELKNVACEQDVSLVVLGEPADGESVFELADLATCAATIEREADVEARIV
ncbi:MAG: universal stress protein [Anaerolineae bacterium]|jgi:nucleotide-binding universal stress UspA family protein